MGAEIERKYRVIADTWRARVARSYPIEQGYLVGDPERAVRVRIKGDHAYLTIKGQTRGIERAEYEYDIPVQHAREMLDTLCLPGAVRKRRHEVEVDGMTWEIDEFSGDNHGLIIAEVELEDAAQHVTVPDWAGEEVSHDARYFNAALARKPFREWDENSGTPSAAD